MTFPTVLLSLAVNGSPATEAARAVEMQHPINLAGLFEIKGIGPHRHYAAAWGAIIPLTR